MPRVNSFTFLGMHISDQLTQAKIIDAITKKAHQCFYFLGGLRRSGVLPNALPDVDRSYHGLVWKFKHSGTKEAAETGGRCLVHHRY